MDVEVIHALISQGEGQRVEFKETLAETKAAIEALCAFANAQGGSVIFGVKDDGSRRTLDLGPNTITGFINEMRRNAQLPDVQVEEIAVDDQGSIVVATTRGRLPGELFMASGRALIRIGKSNQRMTTDEIRTRLMESVNELTPPQVSPGTNGSNGYLIVKNPGNTEQFAVRVSNFVLGAESLLRAKWRSGQEEQSLKRGESDWLLIFTVEPDPIPPISPFGYKLTQNNSVRDQWEKRQAEGKRRVRFYGANQASFDIEVAIQEEYAFTATVLSDTRDPVIQQFTYSVTSTNQVVLPHDPAVVERIEEQAEQMRLANKAQMDDFLRRWKLDNLESQSDAD